MPLTRELGDISPVTEHCVFKLCLHRRRPHYHFYHLLFLPHYHLPFWKYKPQYNNK